MDLGHARRYVTYNIINDRRAATATDSSSRRRRRRSVGMCTTNPIDFKSNDDGVSRGI